MVQKKERYFLEISASAYFSIWRAKAVCIVTCLKRLVCGLYYAMMLYNILVVYRKQKERETFFCYRIVYFKGKVRSSLSTSAQMGIEEIESFSDFLRILQSVPNSVAEGIVFPSSLITVSCFHWVSSIAFCRTIIKESNRSIVVYNVIFIDLRIAERGERENKLPSYHYIYNHKNLNHNVTKKKKKKVTTQQ